MSTGFTTCTCNVALDPALPADWTGLVGSKTRFEPFVGVAPRRYMELFDAPERKLNSGELVDWAEGTAEPRLADLEPEELRVERLPYLARERAAQDLLAEIVRTREPKLHGDPPAAGAST